MSEKVLGCIRVMRLTISFRHQAIHEALVITPNRVFVTRLGEEPQSGWAGGPYNGDIGGLIDAVIDGLLVSSEQDKANRKRKELEELAKVDLEKFLKIDKHNYVIPNSEITKVELKKGWIGIKISLITNKRKFKGYAKTLGFSSPYTTGTTAPEKGVKLEDFENVLRPVFGDRLSVKR